jgi:hypothetical protein
MRTAHEGDAVDGVSSSHNDAKATPRGRKKRPTAAAREKAGSGRAKKANTERAAAGPMKAIPLMVRAHLIMTAHGNNPEAAQENYRGYGLSFLTECDTVRTEGLCNPRHISNLGVGSSPGEIKKNSNSPESPVK